MPALEENWQPIALSLGYAHEKEMLKSLYEEDNFSIKDLAKLLGFAAWSVRRRLMIYGIPLRSRGGPNRTGKRSLLEVSDDELFGNTRDELAARYKVNPCTVSAERKLRKCNIVLSVQQDG